MKNKCDKS